MKLPVSIRGRFKSDSSKVSTIEKLEFIIEIVVIEKEAKIGFNKIEDIFNELREVAQRSSIPNTTIKVCNPGEISKQFKRFEIESDFGLGGSKVKVSLQVLIVILFNDVIDFWKKGLYISLVIDVLESFCERNSKKNISIWLERAKLESKNVNIS